MDGRPEVLLGMVSWPLEVMPRRSRLILAAVLGLGSFACGITRQPEHPQRRISGDATQAAMELLKGVSGRHVGICIWAHPDEGQREERKLGKISGPLLDRIDIHIEAPAVKYNEMRSEVMSEESAEIRGRVERARAAQKGRGFYNAQMPSKWIRKHCRLDEAGERTLEMAVQRLGLSARAHDRVLKVARTIADLGGQEGVLGKHVAEAVQYRSLDRNYWM